MKTCIIFCAAAFDRLAEPIGPADYLLAADGGLGHFEKLNRKPDGILGDFDSLGYVPQGANVFPVEKDDTDAMLAVRQGLAMGYRRFVIYGGLDGPRLDHTVANFQTLQFLADHDAVGYLVGLQEMVTVVKNGQLTFPAGTKGNLSLFCLGEPATGVTLENLKYPLKNGTLTPGFPLGVSNRFLEREARIEVGQGSLLAIWDRSAGFPSR